MRPTLVIGTVALFAALAVVYTWPLAAHLDDFVAFGRSSWLGRADLMLTSWILSWDCHQLLRAPLELFHANVFAPIPNALAFSEHLLAGALLILPVDLVWHDPVLDHDVLVLTSFALGGAATALLLIDLGVTWAAAVGGGILFAFSPLRLAQIGHVQSLSTHWMPVTLLFLQRALRTGSRWPAGLLAASAVLVGLSSVYAFFYFGVAAGCFFVLHALWRCPAAPHARRNVILAGALALVVLAPTFAPYADVRERFGSSHDPEQVIGFSAVASQWIPAIPPGHPVAIDGRLVSAFFGPGLAALAALGLWRGAAARDGGRRLTVVHFCVAGIMALVSLGPLMRIVDDAAGGIPGPHALFAAVVPGFAGLRVPQRAAASALLSLCVLAGLGADAAVRRFGRYFVVGAVLVLGVAAAESWRGPLSLVPGPGANARGAHAWLAQHPDDGMVVELPLRIGFREAEYMVESTRHWRPLVNGYSRIFPGRTYLQDTLAGFPDPPSLRLLDGLGVRDVVLRTPLVCPRLVADARPYLALAYADRDSCVLRILGAPPPAARPPDHPLSLAGMRLTSSAGDDPAAAIDGQRATHWTQAVDPRHEGWLQIELPEPRPLTRIVIRLGRHFGEHLRAYAVATSDDGVTWATVATIPVAPTPLAAFVTDPDDVTTEIALPGTPVRHLRVVRTAARLEDTVLFLDWDRWGVHELELYEQASTP